MDGRWEAMYYDEQKKENSGAVTRVSWHRGIFYGVTLSFFSLILSLEMRGAIS